MARSTPRSVFFSLLLGCAASAQQTPAAAPHTAIAPSAPPGASISRTLSAEAQYLELVQSALALEGKSTAGACLLATRSDGYELASDVAPAVRPLPLPVDDLDALLKQVESVELLSGWGRYGNGGANLALASFTLHPPAHEAVALLLTDQGIALRGVSGRAALRHDALDVPQAVELLRRRGAPLVFVAAERAIPLASLQMLLATLDAARLPVALAVNLAGDTKLPVPMRESSRATACDDGLPPTDAPDGNLPGSELNRGLGALSERLPDCLLRGDASGAAGGRLTLAFRINASGRVQEACVAKDDIDDPGVAACVIELARSLSFAPPSPSGVLDIELPLALRPSPRAAQPATCAQ